MDKTKTNTQNVQHLNIRVHGKVQGVFFRKNTEAKAKALGINGFVRNEPDGTVYAEAEGSISQLDQFTDWLEEGPEIAVVSKLETNRGALKGFEDFRIEYAH